LRKTAVRLTSATSNAILGKLRHAVALQIGLWDTTLEIAEMVDADLFFLYMTLTRLKT
jgi:hypothetical protein